MRARWNGLRGDDRGVGIVTVVFVMAVVTALGITATTLTVNNLDNSRRDRQALAALASSEAGISQAVARLRTGSLAALTCMDPESATPGLGCTTDVDSWTNPENPKQVRLDGSVGACTSSTDCFRVWIGTLQPYVPNCAGRLATPPEPCTGVYRIHATGVSGEGPGARQLAVDVEVEPFTYPMGVFADNFAGSGQVGIYRQSLFTTGCVQNRVKDDGNQSGVRFAWDDVEDRTVLDLIYNRPSAAHAEGEISTANNSCSKSGNAGPIHEAGVCNKLFPFDQSVRGGDLEGTDCATAYAEEGITPVTSKFEDLETRYGYQEGGLTGDQYAALRSQADSEQTLNLAPSEVAGRLEELEAAGITSPVLYWDEGSVQLKESNFPDSFKRPLSEDAKCTTNSLTIIVDGENYNLDYQGGNSGNGPGGTPEYLVAAIFVPKGALTGTGGRQTIGTVFAKTIDMSGNNGYYMDPCFANNPPGGTVDVEVLDWREDDSRDFN